MTFVKFIRARIESVLQARARAAAREQLLQLSDRILDDVGMSRELLEQGVSAWPWRAGVVPAAARRKALARERKRAIRELQACSDRELNDMGLSRAGIVDAVIYGRPVVNDADYRRVA